MPTTEEILSAAWKHCAPSSLAGTVPFPRGFWPDVARVAVEMVQQDTLEPNLDFTPTMCARGGFEAPREKNKKKLTESILNDLEGMEF